MDEDVIRAMLKWPNVPALYGWVRLDRRGHWHLQGQPVTRDMLIAFINRNYGQDEQGRWYFQNGPQRGYVELDYTPWVLRAQLDGSLQTHTGQPVQKLSAAFLDEQGSVLLVCEHGVGLLADTDLEWAVQRLRIVAASRDEETLDSAIERLLAGEPIEISLQHQEQSAPISLMQSADIPEYFGFVAQPVAEEKQ